MKIVFRIYNIKIMEEEKEKVVISIDTEFLSSNIISGQCLQLAFVVIKNDPDYNNLEDENTWILDKLSLCFKPQENKFIEKTVAEWWTGFLDISQRISSEAKDIKICMEELQVWLNDVYSKYSVVGFLADHSSVDMPWFRNLYLEHCEQNKNIFVLPWACLCTTNMVFTLVELGLTKKQINDFCKSKKLKHTHYALDDAMECGYFYLRLKMLMKNHTLIDNMKPNYCLFSFFVLLGIAAVSLKKF